MEGRTPPRRTAPRPLPGTGPPPPPSTSWILYVDLDAYYVACELRDRPDLKGRTVIVGPPPSEHPGRGVVLSASYEARAFGVKSAQPVRTAARLCPEAVWIAPDFEKYERIAHQVRELLRHHSNHVVPYSIDEAVVLAEVGSAAEARERALAIQVDLRTSLGLSASIGVANTRVVAKIASDRAKPGGILVVPRAEVASFVAPLAVRAIPGVGPRTEEILARHEIRTIGDLATRQPHELLRDLGGFARELIALAQGVPTETPEEPSGPRSRSADRTFDSDQEDLEPLLGAVRFLASELGASLDREGLRYGSVGVAFRWSDFDRTERRRSMVGAREGPASLVEEAVRLAQGLWTAERAGRGRAVRTVSVRAERLAERTQRQASLDDYRPTHRPPET
ncbi:MAG: Y-family DNA polymerase [Thermoplasmata archaeon]